MQSLGGASPSDVVTSPRSHTHHHHRQHFLTSPNSRASCLPARLPARRRTPPAANDIIETSSETNRLSRPPATAVRHPNTLGRLRRRVAAAFLLLLRVLAPFSSATENPPRRPLSARPVSVALAACLLAARVHLFATRR